MTIERVYLGAWHQRTNLHLEEAYHFLRGAEGVAGLDTARSGVLRERLGAKDVVFNDTRMNDVRFASGDIACSLTEDGVLLLSREGGEPTASVAALIGFLKDTLDPALRHLYSRGAPIPKHVAKIEDAHVAVVVGRDIPDAERERLYAPYQDEAHSSTSADGISVLAGDELIIVDLGAAVLPEEALIDLVRDLVFFREFERQLHAYLRMHRPIWDGISRVREARGMRYRDFPSVRSDIMSSQKTLGIVSARLTQMEDIMAARRQSESKEIAALLAKLGMYNFNSLFASKKYVAHLWEMTVDYADDTLRLLETLYQENTQHELNALKIITLTTAVTSFFGMNIAFPWDESWHINVKSSIAVTAIVAGAALALYYGLKALIHNRYFIIKEESRDK